MFAKSVCNSLFSFVIFLDFQLCVVWFLSSIASLGFPDAFRVLLLLFSCCVTRLYNSLSLRCKVSSKVSILFCSICAVWAMLSIMWLGNCPI